MSRASLSSQAPLLNEKLGVGGKKTDGGKEGERERVCGERENERTMHQSRELKRGWGGGCGVDETKNSSSHVLCDYQQQLQRNKT